MRNEAAIRERFLADPLPIRLGGMAANLARIRSFARNDLNRAAVGTLLEETRRFVDWTATDASAEALAGILDLRAQLMQWEARITGAWDDAGARTDLSRWAGEWSDRVLSLSGLLPQPSAVREKGRP